MTAARLHHGDHRPPPQNRLMPAADLDPGIPAQLIRQIGVPIPLHLSLVDG
jgi:hypothetical protein